MILITYIKTLLTSLITEKYKMTTKFDLFQCLLNNTISMSRNLLEILSKYNHTICTQELISSDENVLVSQKYTSNGETSINIIETKSQKLLATINVHNFKYIKLSPLENTL